LKVEGELVASKTVPAEIAFLFSGSIRLKKQAGHKTVKGQQRWDHDVSVGLGERYKWLGLLGSLYGVLIVVLGKAPKGVRLLAFLQPFPEPLAWLCS
jgi:hypothetical protein